MSNYHNQGATIRVRRNPPSKGFLAIGRASLAHIISLRRAHAFMRPMNAVEIAIRVGAHLREARQRGTLSGELPFRWAHRT